jgi:putative component of membrane protein insertase Oxa1/YidC/SpoIIIJ protein YidD
MKQLSIMEPLKGPALGAKRISKCHPWSEASYDPVPKKIKTI